MHRTSVGSSPIDPNLEAHPPMSSFSKTSPSSKASSSPEFSPEVAAEIARLMRDPDSMRVEAEQMRRSIGGGHYDPNQPRVPAGDPKGGQFASKGYRGGGLGRDVGMTRASLDRAQFAELGSGNPANSNTQTVPFDGQLGEISPAQHLTSQNGFIQAERDRRTNPTRTQVRPFEAGVGGPNNSGRYEFLATGGLSVTNGLRGPQAVVSSTTYVHDRLTGAYATIRATPTRPIEILEIDGQVYIGSFR